MIRVAALMDTVKVSGPARQLAAIASPLASAGVELHVLAFHPVHDPETPFIRHLREADVRCTPVPAYGRLRWRTLRAMNAAFDAARPDIVQTHSYRPNAHVLLSRLVGRRPEPWLAFFHGTTAENRLVKLYHALDRFLLARADAVCVVAKSQREHLAHIRNVSIVPNAVLLPDSPRSIVSTFPRTDAVLYVGRLSHEKGVDVLLEAWPGVVASRPSATLTVVGDGPERFKLDAQCDRLGIRGSVRFIGHQETPWPFYAQASVVVLPSRSEGIPNVLLEAVARDLRIVATRVGGVPDVLGDPPAGELVGAEDAPALCQALLVATDPDRVDNTIEARTRVREAFSVAARARMLASRYRELIRPKA